MPTTRVGLAPLIDYYTALAGKTGHDFLDAASREIGHLGLLPDPEFFNDPHEAAVKRRLERNRELSSRLQMLNAQDRRRITDVLQAETDDDARKALQEALSQLDRTRVDGGGGTAISFQAADQLVRARVKKPKPERRASDRRRRRSPRSRPRHWSTRTGRRTSPPSSRTSRPSSTRSTRASCGPRRSGPSCPTARPRRSRPRGSICSTCSARCSARTPTAA